jgi:hypothetical protein
MKHSDWFGKGVKGIQWSSQKTLNTCIYACTPINRIPVMAPTFGVTFLKGRFSLKNGTFCPLFSHDTTSFKYTYFLINLTGFLLWLRYRRQYWGYIFGGRFSLKNGTICPLSSHDSSYFKNMCLLI